MGPTPFQPRAAKTSSPTSARARSVTGKSGSARCSKMVSMGQRLAVCFLLVFFKNDGRWGIPRFRVER